jgi:hypothetical protein
MSLLDAFCSRMKGPHKETVNQVIRSLLPHQQEKLMLLVKENKLTTLLT